MLVFALSPWPLTPGSEFLLSGCFIYSLPFEFSLSRLLSIPNSIYNAKIQNYSKNQCRNQVGLPYNSTTRQYLIVGNKSVQLISTQTFFLWGGKELRKYKNNRKIIGHFTNFFRALRWQGGLPFVIFYWLRWPGLSCAGSKLFHFKAQLDYIAFGTAIPFLFGLECEAES